VVAVVEEGLVWDLFSGIIRQDPRHPNLLVGGMIDHYGESALREIILEAQEVSFSKKYARREDLIRYRFTVKEENIWIGEYTGPKVGSGTAYCTVAEVPEWFIHPQHAQKILEKPHAHTW